MHARPYSLTNGNQILYGDRTVRDGKIFTGSTVPLPAPETFVAPTLTRDLFAVADFVAFLSTYLMGFLKGREWDLRLATND